MTDEELSNLRNSCPRALTHDVRPSAKQSLLELAQTLDDATMFDKYGAAPWLAEFEAQIARELGKEAAVFLPTGTLAQPIALRIWCDAARNPTIAFHPTCHLEIWESRGYAMLHGLRSLTVGAATRLMTVDDVRAIADPLGAFLIELPQREIGAQLPPWDDLVALCAAARETGAKLHMDGARLWEAAPFYGRSHAEISALFDSVYVSFYKGLGAFAGAMLAGSADFIALARQWQHRSGGRPFALAPYALSARLGFERNVGKMAAYRDRAVAIANQLANIAGVTIVPSPPQTNTFHVFLSGDRGKLEDAAHAYARETGIFTFARLAPTGLPDRHKWEFVAAEATLQLGVADVASAVSRIVRDARQG
jgi:threonine aldolase